MFRWSAGAFCGSHAPTTNEKPAMSKNEERSMHLLWANMTGAQSVDAKNNPQVSPDEHELTTLHSVWNYGRVVEYNPQYICVVCVVIFC